LKHRPKPFRVFETGAGDIPFGRIGQALKAKRKGLNREFIAVDTALNESGALRQRNLRVAPSNLKLVKDCASSEMKKIAPNSQDIVFSSFFLNNYCRKAGENNWVETVREYFKLARRILKPNGRIIVIQNQMGAIKYSTIAEEMGLKVSVVKLPQRMIDASTAEYIEKRASAEDRKKLVQHDIEKYPDHLVNVMHYAREHNLKDWGDAYWPTAIIIRK
jgi:ubiquinone/menaquinone biosynthesis C-methylase UbiE